MAKKQPKILIISKPAVGDALLATPLIHSIREQEPDALIDLLLVSSQEGIVEGNPDLDNVLTLNSRPGAAELGRAIRQMWRRYDIGISNAVDDRAHLYLWAFAKKRIAVHIANTSAWKHWITADAVFEGEEGTHTLLRNNALGNLLGYGNSYKVLPPRLPADAVKRELPGNLVNSAKGYAVLHLDARLPYKRWTEQGWRDIAKHLSARGMHICLTGGGGADENRYISSMLGPLGDTTHNFSGKLSFAATSELIATSRIYIGVDTVNSHIAAAHGVPTVVLFGPERPYRWGPWPAGYEAEASPWSDSGTQRVENVMIVQSANNCAVCQRGFCEKRRSRASDCPLMTGITSQQVTDAIETMLPQPA